MSDYNEIQEALKVLELNGIESLTLKELNQIHRDKAFHFHPDMKEQRSRNGGKIKIIEELIIMQQVNRAYDILKSYFENFEYTFTQEDVARVYPREEFDRKQNENWEEWNLNHA